jgi:hypothetical protein
VIQVSFNGSRHTSVKKYKTKTRAMNSIRVWFQRNEGYVVFFQPELPPTYYHSLQELPAASEKQCRDFYKSAKWVKLRDEVLEESDKHCSWCGRGNEHGVYMVVDHIKPRATNPHLELAKSNLHVLCNECHAGKQELFDDDVTH